MIYALDSNIITYLLKSNTTVYSRLNKAVDEGGRCIIPPIAYYEVKRGLLACNATKKASDFELLCFDFGVGDMNLKTWDESARLYALQREKGRTIEDADLFIAAFCIANDCTLVTNNTRHFQGINDLKLVNWTT